MNFYKLEFILFDIDNRLRLLKLKQFKENKMRIFHSYEYHGIYCELEFIVNISL